MSNLVANDIVGLLGKIFWVL